jgi:hypothetical protein
MNYHDSVERIRAQRPDLAAEVASFTGVTSILNWMQTRGLTGTKVDIIGQDEFESDFLIRLGSDREWISFGIT